MGRQPMTPVGMLSHPDRSFTSRPHRLCGLSRGYPTAWETVPREPEAHGPNIPIRIKMGFQVSLYSIGAHGPQAECRLVLIGATPEGKKERLGFQVGMRERVQSWRELRADFKARGFAIAPELATGDEALGFWKALDEALPRTRHPRCTRLRPPGRALAPSAHVNPIESVFATVSHRTVRLMIFKPVMAAAKTGRRLKGKNQKPKVVQGVIFRNGVKVINTQAQNAAGSLRHPNSSIALETWEAGSLSKRRCSGLKLDRLLHLSCGFGRWPRGSGGEGVRRIYQYYQYIIQDKQASSPSPSPNNNADRRERSRQNTTTAHRIRVSGQVTQATYRYS